MNNNSNPRERWRAAAAGVLEACQLENEALLDLVRIDLKTEGFGPLLARWRRLQAARLRTRKLRAAEDQARREWLRGLDLIKTSE